MSKKLAAAWRPGGLVYLGWCLAALACGLWPQAIYPSRRDIAPAPLPGLQALAAGQALFILLVHPLLLLARGRKARPACASIRGDAARQSGSSARFWAEAIVESLTWLLATAPLYVATAWLADATAGDVIRAAIALLCLWPLGWSAGFLLQRRPALRPAVILLLLAAANLPCAHYVAREFLRPMSADWLWRLAPAAFLWDAAASRAGPILPRPFWPPAIWLAAAAALAALAALAAVAKPARPRQVPTPPGSSPG